MRTENRTCRGIRRSVLIFLIRGNTLPALLLPFRSAWICSSTAALPGSAWQNGIFPPKTRNALPQRRMLKRCFSGSGPKRRATAIDESVQRILTVKFMRGIIPENVDSPVQAATAQAVTTTPQ